MGLFDFLKPKKSRPAAEAGGVTVHYAFAHVAFRSAALSDPFRCLAVMASDKGTEVIKDLLQRCEKDFGASGPIEANQIIVHRQHAGKFPCLILEMPEPKEVAEAHFVALVVFVDAESAPLENLSDVESAYFTLEKSVNLEGEADAVEPTVFGGWTDGAHLNFGAGPSPVLDDFRRRVELEIQSR